MQLLFNHLVVVPVVGRIGTTVRSRRSVFMPKVYQQCVIAGRNIGGRKALPPVVDDSPKIVKSFLGIESRLPDVGQPRLVLVGERSHTPRAYIGVRADR